MTSKIKPSILDINLLEIALNSDNETVIDALTYLIIVTKLAHGTEIAKFEENQDKVNGKHSWFESIKVAWP